MSYQEVDFSTEQTAIDQMAGQFQQLRRDYQQAPYPEYAERIELLDGIKQALLDHQEQLVEAMSQDFGRRTPFDSCVGELVPTMEHIHYTRRKLKKWMRSERRRIGLLLVPSKLQIRYQPVGVVGIMSPWNFPVFLSLVPMVTALAAGNRVLLKLSEFTPETNAVIAKLLAPFAAHVQISEGEAEVSSAFSELPFDHLLFTGSTQVGRLVARAAAANLTPVTLELGGKSPAIIQPGANLKRAVENIFCGKAFNSGQVCVAPDYVLLPEGCKDEFIRHYKALYQEHLATSPKEERTWIVNERQHARLQALLNDAKEKGARLHDMGQQSDVDHIEFARAPAHILLDQVTDEMRIMQEEIFGPLLHLVEYREFEQAIQRVQRGPRPLALYVMGSNKALNEQILKTTHSGGSGVNDVVLHVGALDAPVGGIGDSGMGHYHGIEGFRRFSHAKTTLVSYEKLPKQALVMKLRPLVLKLTRWLYMR